MGKKKFNSTLASPKVVAQSENTEDVITKSPKKSSKRKINVRARKLYEPFMTFLKSYQAFAETLPRRFLEFDDKKREDLAQKDEEAQDGEDDEKLEETSEPEEIEEETKNSAVQKKKTFGSTTRAKTIAELKQRLADLRGKKLDYQERLKKKGLKSRLTKKQRLEERAKLKKEKQKLKKKSSKSGNLNKPKPVEDDVKPQPKAAEPPTMIFSKLEVPQEEGFKKKVNKDPKRMLQKIEKSQKKLKELEAKGKTDTVMRIKEKMAWDSAIKKAEGVKVKDDVELLKKTIRKKTELKKHSKKKWDKRLEATEHRKKDSQAKRNENISKKLKEKKQKKIKKSIKKGRVVL
ncbi:Surfeit locus protein 6 [Nesidiocoris tenuis]|uniref:Surfeit locus protein 6 n=1 Tax=Nesidiocoris tenuis TaxID=355587 RepID=A0ABN7AMQ7_9HEMI|nr:Surfeit locus protein 6 [Nesidiocoris tenuis]